jgi:acetyltransferase-like isoleucine patch superfamily enzyme
MINYLFAYFSWLLPPPLNKYCHKIKGVEFTNIKSVRIGLGTIIDNLFPNYVLIEEDVIISFGVRIITHIEVPDVNKEMYKFIPKKVIIKKNVFIGSS